LCFSRVGASSFATVSTSWIIATGVHGLWEQSVTTRWWGSSAETVDRGSATHMTGISMAVSGR